jgi:toxin ParE1/3/4
MNAADQYDDGLIARFETIAENPQFWPAVDHIGAGYRRFAYVVPSIHYRTDATGVQIVRVLGRENPTTSLPEG